MVNKENLVREYIHSTMDKIRKENHTARKRINGKTSIRYQGNQILFTIFWVGVQIMGRLIEQRRIGNQNQYVSLIVIN